VVIRFLHKRIGTLCKKRSRNPIEERLQFSTNIMATTLSRGNPDEKIEWLHRTTKEGRKLRYKLSVIQQPERARACGSGAKSSADRRPVDPPPVVELRIFADETDITFSYNANFFLYATLEVARPMAHGRVQPSAPQIPVLTGMPVSGMAYLDRPTEAGYFIFPDLSVRHEGLYKLSFNLYEETKEDKDADVEPTKDDKPSATGASDSAFMWRMEVKSLAFTVFSAKKFPGLAESTGLSRTIAEQGCRVRIRRDVRMRRRDEKSNRDFEENAAEDEYARAGRAATPASRESYRHRSISNSSEEGRQPYPDQQRRPSGDYQSAPYPNHYPAPSTPHTSGPQNYLSFGNSSSAQYQAPPPPPQFTQPQSQPPTPNQNGYPHSGPQYRQPTPQSNYGFSERPSYPPQYASSNPPVREVRESYEPEYRRGSVGYAPHPSPVSHSGTYPPVDSSFNRNAPAPQYQGFPPRSHTPIRAGPVNLAPLKMPPLEPKYDNLASPIGPLSSVGRLAPPLPSPSHNRSQERTDSYIPYSTPNPETSRNGGKRSFDTVFKAPAHAVTQPLYNGMRPPSSHATPQEEFDDDNDELSIEQLKMQYKRADGTSYSRELPILE
jgi:hypothetical protein